MKKSLFLLAALFLTNFLYAKKIKFSVNMQNETVNTTGVHVYGDFQAAAGFDFDWDPGSTAMTQETGDTNVYTVVLDVPAFQVYQYRFINGNQAYEVEFVPEESRVNGAFNDNRWLYLDSASDDTAFIGVIPYSLNAPAGLSLVVFKVNMTGHVVSTDGIHVVGNFQGWDPAKSTMITFNDTVYRFQAYIPVGTYQFKFVNGKTWSDCEYVGGPCAVNGSRQVTVTADVALDPVNFSSCLVGIDEKQSEAQVILFPNPSSGNVSVEFNDNKMHTAAVSDVAGRVVRAYQGFVNSQHIENLDPGIYTVTIFSDDDQAANLRLVVQ